MSPTETSSGNGTAIVTGGARGIGRACALRLAGGRLLRRGLGR